LIQFSTVRQALRFATTVAARDIVQISSLRQLMGGAHGSGDDSPQDLHAEAARILDIIERGLTEDELAILCMLYVEPHPQAAKPKKLTRRRRRDMGPLSEDFDRIAQKVAAYLSLDVEGMLLNPTAARVVVDGWLQKKRRKHVKGGPALAKMLKVRRTEAYKRREKGWETLRRWQYQAFAKAHDLLVESGHVAGSDWRDHVEL
jgi:hypothetical protein